MTNDEFETPTAAAFASFKERITQDDSLPAPIRTAVLDDLGSENPRGFERLKAAIAAQEQGHEDHKPKGQ
jgi:hypothetical protein